MSLLKKSKGNLESNLISCKSSSLSRNAFGANFVPSGFDVSNGVHFSMD